MPYLPDPHFEPTVPPSPFADRREGADDYAWADLIARSHAERFDNVWWGFVDTYATPHPFRVVEIGTGPGLLVRDLCERFPDAEIIGIDSRADVLARAHALLDPYDNARILRHDLASGPVYGLDDAQADLVVVAVGLRQLSTPGHVLDEAFRVLAPGGALLVYDWVRSPFASEGDDGRLLGADDDEPERFTADDLVWLVERSGFAVHETLTRGEHGRVMIAARRRES